MNDIDGRYRKIVFLKNAPSCNQLESACDRLDGLETI